MENETEKEEKEKEKEKEKVKKKHGTGKDAKVEEVDDENVDIEIMFAAFAKYEDPKADGKTITLTNSDKWMKQAKLLDMKTITTTDTGVHFNKFKARTLDFKKFKLYLQDLATTKNMNADEMLEKLRTCGMPGRTGATLKKKPEPKT